MKKITLFALFAVLIQTSSVFAGAPTWKEKCVDLKSCIENVSALTGEQYVFDRDVKGEMHFTDNLPFEKEDAELIFTTVLFQNGVARVPMKPGVYQILRINDAKGKDLPYYTCDQRNPPKLPNTYDLVTMEYKFTNPAMAKESENVIRTYSDMGARIYGVESNGTLIIVEVAKNLNKIYRMLVSLDIKPSTEYLGKMKAREAAWLKAKAEGKDDHGPRHDPAPPKKDDHKS